MSTIKGAVVIRPLTSHVSHRASRQIPLAKVSLDALSDRDTVHLWKILPEDREGTLHVFILLSHRRDIVNNAFGGFPVRESGDHPRREIVRRQAASRGSYISMRDERFIEDLHSCLLDPGFRLRIGACRDVCEKSKLREHQGSGTLGADHLTCRVQLQLR